MGSNSAANWMAITGRFARFALAALCLVIGLFLMTRLLGGDPVRASLGPTAPPELVAARRATLHLDRPLVEQLLLYLTGLFHGDLGSSITTGEPVAQSLLPRFENSLFLGLVASLLPLIAAPIGMGVAIAGREGRRPLVRRIFLRSSGLMSAMPEILLAAALIACFAIALNWLPAAGRDDWRSFILPAMTLGAAPAALLARIAHAETRRALSEPYMLTARSKHLPPLLLYGRHLLPNVCGATLTVGGLLFANLLGGAVLVETIFAWPGLGSSLVAAITVRDYPMVQAIGLILGMEVLIVNALIDLALMLLYRDGR